MRPASSLLSTKTAQALFIGVGYFALARLGLSLAFETTQVTAVWPPTGFALAALVLAGPWAAAGIFAGAFAANALAMEPLAVAAGIAAGNTLTGMAGWWMLRAAQAPKPAFSKVQEVLALALAALATPLLSATCGVACLRLGGLIAGPAIPTVWRVWWVGDALGILLVAPLILTWAAPVESRWNLRRAFEGILLLATTVSAGLLVFCGALEISDIHFRAYAGFPLLIWAALRFGPRATVTAGVGLSCFAVWGAIHGHGPFGSGPPDNRLLDVDTFVGVSGITALLMGAASAERQGALRELAIAHGELEGKVEARTAELAAANGDLARKHGEIETGRRFLESVVEHLPVALVVKSAREGDFGKVELWNPAAERIFGVSKQQAMGLTPPEFLRQQEEGARVLAKDREVASTGNLVEIPDGTFHLPDLGIRHLRTTIVPLHGPGGPVQEILTLSADITEQRRAERALQESEGLHREIVESLSEGVTLQSRKGSLFRSNAKAGEILGLDPEQIRDFDAMGWRTLKEDGSLMPREARPDQVTLRTGRPVDGVILGVQKPDGTLTWLRVNAHPIQLAMEDDLDGVVVSFLDFTLEKYYRDSLLKSEERYALAAVGGRTGILDLDLKANSVFYSDSWKSMLGFAPNEISSQPEELLGRIHPEDLVPALDALRSHIKGRTPEFQVDLRVQHKDGAWLWLLSRGMAVRDARGRALRVTGSQTDITAQKAMEERLFREANRDELTGLYNRRHFNEALAAYMGSAASHGHSLSLAVGDLDRFKQINDTHGHPAGDEVIKRFAARVTGILRGKDLAARIGGDEFCILFPFTAAEQAAAGLERLRGGLAAEVFRGPDGSAFQASATFGIAGLEPGMTQEQLVKAADDALYEAKRRGRNQVAIAPRSQERKA